LDPTLGFGYTQQGWNFHSPVPGEAMSEPQSRYVQCPVLVVRVTESQVMGDTVADALRDELLAMYLQTNAVHVVIDMHQVVYLSSAGIRPLLALNRQVREREGRLVLCGLTSDVESVFVATRLISMSRSVPATFENAPDVPGAIAGLYQTS
jgi:anti-anti-sigma factor